MISSSIISPNLTNSTTTIPQQQQQQQHQHQQQQPILNRPTSAYFNNNANSQPTQMPYMMPNTNPQQQQQQQQTTTNGINGRPKANFIRDAQSQQSLRINQMMAPSMPNIAHSSGYASNISASQSMQNVNMINAGVPQNYHGGYGQQKVVSHQNVYHQDLQLQHQQHLQQQQHQQQSATLLRGQQKLSDVNEMMKRRHQRQAEMMPMHSLDSPQSQISPVKQLPPTAPKPQGNRQPQQLVYKEEVSPPLPPTSTHPLFKTATATAVNYNTNSDHSGASDPTKTAFYTASSVATSQQQQKNIAAGSNPWEREEREKEHEYRREQIRQWRDQQINDIASQPHRTQQQEEQLKTLMLERDFERRAQESDEDDVDDDTNDIVPLQPVVADSRLSNQQQQISPTNSKQSDGPIDTLSYPSYPLPQHHTSMLHQQVLQAPKSILKHNVNRLDDTASISNPSSPSKQAKSASFADDRQIDNGMSSVARDLSNLSFNNYDMNQTKEHHQIESSSSYEIMNPAMMNVAPPPPPPERNSSYVIMSQKQLQQHTNLRTSSGVNSAATIPPPPPPSNFVDQQLPAAPTTNLNYMTSKRPTNLNNNNNSNIINNTNANNNHFQQQNNISTAMPVGSVANMSLTAMLANRDRDNKRVSFHDDDNNYIGSGQQQQMMMMGDQAEMEVIREDLNNVSVNFIIFLGY